MAEFNTLAVLGGSENQLGCLGTTGAQEAQEEDVVAVLSVARLEA